MIARNSIQKSQRKTVGGNYDKKSQEMLKNYAGNKSDEFRSEDDLNDRNFKVVD